MNRNDDLLNIALKTEQAGCRKDDTQCCGTCSKSSIENQREKLAFENGMAIEFVNWFFDNKKDGCGSVWFMMMAAMWEGWSSRDAQVKQLAMQLELSVEAERAWETTMMRVCGEDGPLSVAGKFNQLAAERDAVVSENVALKAAFNPEEIPDGAVDAFTDTVAIDSDWDESGSWSYVDNEQEVIRAVLGVLAKPETPATSAILAPCAKRGWRWR